MQFKNLISACMAAAILVVTPASADSKAKTKTYDEVTFVKTFGNKSMKQVTEILGAPARKQISVKPANASGVIATQMIGKNEKPVKVEMWYYNNIVRYEPKKTYKTTELTFVNGRCSNVAFFNNL